MSKQSPFASRALLLLPLIALASCVKGEDGSLVKSEVPAEPDVHIMPLGTGYYSALYDFISTPACAAPGAGDEAPSLVALEAPEATFKAGYSEEQSSNTDRIHSTATVKGSLGILKVEGSLGVETALIDSDLKTSVFTTFTHSPGNAALVNARISDHGKTVAASSFPLVRYFGCGDEYVYQVQLGGRLHIGLEFAFASKEMKNDFNIKVGASAKVAGKKIKKTLLEGDKSFNFESLRGTARVIFEQEGGNRAEYEHWKTTLHSNCTVKGKVTEETQDGRLVKVGEIEGINDCISDYHRLVTEYAAVRFPKQFKPLREAVAGDLNASGYTALRYYTLPYVQAGMPQFKDELDRLPAILVAFLRGDLVKYLQRYKKLRGELRALENILTNTATDGVVAEVIGKLTQETPFPDAASLRQALNKGAVLAAETENAIRTCRLKLIDGLQQDLKSANEQLPVLKQKMQECDQTLMGKSNEIDSFLTSFNVGMGR